MTARIRERSDLLVAALVSAALLGFFAGAVIVSLWAYRQGDPVNQLQWIDSFAQNFGTEIFGALLTFWLIDRLIGERQRKQAAVQREQERQRQAEERLKQDQFNALTRLKQADSKADRQAILDEMRQRDLLRGINLRKADLPGANLRHANLRDADLSAANLRHANLLGANLSHVILSLSSLLGANLSATDLSDANLFLSKLSDANLSDANLRGASLSTALLVGVDLSGANLSIADLHEADLSRAALGGAHLEGANLYLANLEGAKFVKCEQLRQARRLEKATLPDGTKLPGRTREDFKDDKPEPPWREAFEEWCKTVPVDDKGYIIVDD